jgi:glycosyltransferase involved in cell wall biosynthesis
LLKAFNLLRSKYSFVKLVFIGKESTETKACKEITFQEDLNKRVFYLGSVENAYMLLSTCNLFVFSSYSETFGIAVVEALFMRIPVLTSDIPVMKELSADGKYFRLFETADEKSLAENIEWFVNKTNKEIVDEIVVNAYKYANETFSYERYINQLIGIYSAR